MLDSCVHYHYYCLTISPSSRKPLSISLELESQPTRVKARIQRYRSNSPTSIVEHFEHLAKGAIIMAAKLVLMHNENAELKAVKKAATRRKSYKRKRG